jgi:uncharacterized short protein YbdD (DUF466 family)
MADSKIPSVTQTTPEVSKFKKFLNGSTYTDGKPLIGHLSCVVETMAKQHQDTPVKTFEDVSLSVGQTKKIETSKQLSNEDSDDEGDLGYLRDKPQQIKDYLKKTAEFMVGC